MSFTDKETRMLALLARGLSNKEIADSLGYQAGTMRVYLHTLYSKIGVKNKTSAVLWYLSQTPAGAPSGAAAHAASRHVASESFGAMAMRTDLLAALGIMSTFLGPYSRTWEVSVRLQGRELTDHDYQLIDQARTLWEALLRGDWAVAKRFVDEDRAATLLVESPFDGAVLASMLILGGYSAADTIMKRLTVRKQGTLGLKASEQKLLATLQNIVTHGQHADLAELHRLAESFATHQVFRHWVMVCAFHAYRLTNESERARQCADVLWAEAEAARQHLQEVGENALPSSTRLPVPQSPVVTPTGARKKSLVRA
jgi:DNA-binding CsgD family transcriptional regulator